MVSASNDPFNLPPTILPSIQSILACMDAKRGEADAVSSPHFDLHQGIVQPHRVDEDAPLLALSLSLSPGLSFVWRRLICHLAVVLPREKEVAPSSFCGNSRADVGNQKKG